VGGEETEREGNKGKKRKEVYSNTSSLFHSSERSRGSWMGDHRGRSQG